VGLQRDAQTAQSQRSQSGHLDSQGNRRAANGGPDVKGRRPQAVPQTSRAVTAQIVRGQAHQFPEMGRNSDGQLRTL